MLGHTFAHELLRKYVVLFGTLFNDLYINRKDDNGEIIQTIKVPITYAPKEKMLARLTADPSLNRPVAITLPRMSFEMTGMYYAGTRKLPTTNKNVYVNPDVPKLMKKQYVPVPYDIMFNLYVMVKNAEDGTRILEQIMPFFTPDWTSTVHLIPEMDISMDIPLVLQTVNVEDTYDGNFEERRSLTWTIGFLMKGYLYGPVTKSGIITLANTNFFATPTGEDFGYQNLAANISQFDMNVTITPGQYANGAPSTDANNTIDRNAIEANSTYGYIVKKT